MPSIEDIKRRLTVIQRSNLDSEIEDACEDFWDNLLGVIEYRVIYPKTKAHHVGVEIEFISKVSYDDIFDIILQRGLIDKVSLGYDESINCDSFYQENGYEIKLIDTEKNIKDLIIQVIGILKEVDAEVNSSCGLHVHIDVRNRDRVKTYKNFVRAQDLLYKLVCSSRSDNNYCYRQSSEEPLWASHNRGVELTSKPTIELRMHHGTLDPKIITNWVKLLTSIANKKVEYKRERIISYKSIVNMTSFRPETKEYIKEVIGETG